MSTEQIENNNMERDEQIVDIPTERYLTFRTDGLTMGVSTNYVIEIITDNFITELPRVPDYIRGIINMRGQIVPIIDIRLKMGRSMSEYTDTTCIIVLDINSVYIGIIVDSVQQVIDVDNTQISPIPVEDHQKLVNGMISLSSQEVLLFLNCEELISTY